MLSKIKIRLHREGPVLDLNFEAGGEDNGGGVLTMMGLTRVLMAQVFYLNQRNLTTVR